MAVKVIDIVHHAHTDFGYTDYPLKSRALLKQYVGEAARLVLKYADYPQYAQFTWTAETLLPVWDWWQEAGESDREMLLAAVDTGRFEVMGLPFNITAFLSSDEWDYMMKWIPKPLWNRMKIQSAMQNDVNGLHRGGIRKAYKAGIRKLWIGPNTYNGAPPIPTPTCADWDLGNGETLHLWLNASYCDGFFLFQENWRQGPVPNSSDLRYRYPLKGDIFACDELSVLQAHKRCLANLALIEGTANSAENMEMERDGFTQNKIFGGYTGDVLAVSITNQWRVDNDPPFPYISDFVKKWNEMGLQPQLRLRTASGAMEDVMAGWKGPVPVLQGEWPDWWANGSASSPAELSYSRRAKRLLRAAHADVLGPWLKQQEEQKDEILYQLCRYDEHTYGAWQSIAYPYSFEAKSQRAEKDIFAYRALGMADSLLADRASSLAQGLKNAIKVINPAKIPRTFHIVLPKNCLRGEYKNLREPKLSMVYPLDEVEGIANFLRPKSVSSFSDENISQTFADKVPNQAVAFQLTLPADSQVVLYPDMETVTKQPQTCILPYQMEQDQLGWPVFIQLGGATLFNGTVGDFSSVSANGFAPRWVLRDIFDTEDEKDRKEKYCHNTLHLAAVYSPAVLRESETSIQVEQSFTHPSILFGKRILFVDRTSGVAKLTVRLCRASNMQPEIYYIAVDAPLKEGQNWISNASVAFRPETDQIGGSCKDYYAIDGWVLREHNGLSWMASSRDSALVVFGEPSQPSRRTTLHPEQHKMFFQVFDNTWDTNFTADAHGVMEFTFDFATGVSLQNCEEIAEGLAVEPIVIVRTGFVSNT